MASPVKDTKLKAQQIWPNAVVHARGKGHIVHQHPTNPLRFMADHQVGNVGWHFGDGPFTEANEVDTAWADAHPILDEPWQKKMVLADYNAYAFREETLGFDQGQLIEYVHPASGEAVNFQPTQLQWTNDIDQISPVADPQAVSATIDDDMLTWADAYGSGIDFQWQTQTARLMKYVNIASLADLGSPPQFIIDGGNPVLRVELLFQKSAGVEIWVDGALWNERSNNPQETLNNVEFRLDGEPIWWFKAPKAWDSKEEDREISPLMRIHKSANNLFVEILTPWSWLETATYPVVVDTTVDYQVGASADDADEDGGTVDVTGLSVNTDRSGRWVGWRWQGVTIADGVTISLANIDVSIMYAGGDEPWMGVDFEDGSAPSQFTTGASDISGRTGTTATVTFQDNGPSLGIVNVNDWLSDVSTLIVVTDIVQELEDSYDYSGGSSMVCRAEAIGNGTAYDFSVNLYDGNSAYGAKLHIEYEAGGPTAQGVAGTLVLAGVSWQTTFRDQDVAGTLTLTGAVATMFKSFLELAGTLTLTGAISTLFKSFLEFAGTLTLSGTVSTMFKSFLEFAGTLTLSGAVSDFKLALSRLLGGTLTLAGAISRKLALDRVLAGTLNFAGAPSLKSIWKRTLTGVLALGGAVSSRLRTALALAGTLTLSGTVDRTTKWLRTLTGALSSSGAISRKLALDRVLAGTLNFAGALSLKSLWKRSVAGVLSFGSSLATVLTRAAAGRIITGFIKLALTPVGVIKMWIKR